MITIDFFDANGRFVVRHRIVMETMRPFPFIWAEFYCKAIFYWYKSANCAKVTVGGAVHYFLRYE